MDFFKDFLVAPKDKPVIMFICPPGKGYYYKAKAVVEGAKWSLPFFRGQIGETDRFPVNMTLKDIEVVEIEELKDATKAPAQIEKD